MLDVMDDKAIAFQGTHYQTIRDFLLIIQQFVPHVPMHTYNFKNII